MKRHIDKIRDANYERGYVYNTNYHIIWVTKYRNACFTTPELANEMKSILLDVAKIVRCSKDSRYNHSRNGSNARSYTYFVQLQAKI